MRQRAGEVDAGAGRQGKLSVNAGRQVMTALVVDTRPPLDNGFWNHKPPIYAANRYLAYRRTTVNLTFAGRDRLPAPSVATIVVW
jgi:hypothetical protein